MTDTVRSRRSVVRGAALGGLALPVLAACGTQDQPASAPPTPTASRSRRPGVSRHSARPTPHHDATPDNAPSPSPKPAGVALAATTDIPVGGGAVFPAHGCVVTQPSAGAFKGFSDICTHAGCPVASVSDGTINCPCHGSRFSIVDGSVHTGPAATPLPARKVVVADGQVRLS